MIVNEVRGLPQSTDGTPRHAATHARSGIIGLRANNLISHDTRNVPANPSGKSQLVLSWISEWPFLAAFIAILLLGVGVSQMGFGQAVLKNAGLVGNSGTYTSLAFLNPRGLPTQIGRGGNRVNITFVIRNATTTSRDYQWSLLLLQGKHNRRVNVGEIRVQSGQEASVNKTIKISCRKEKVRITVSLARPAEHIDAFMACKG